MKLNAPDDLISKRGGTFDPVSIMQSLKELCFCCFCYVFFFFFGGGGGGGISNPALLLVGIDQQKIYFSGNLPLNENEM